MRREYAVARNEDSDRVFAAGTADSANGIRLADHFRHFTIAARLAESDLPQRVPDGLLKRCS